MSVKLIRYSYFNKLYTIVLQIVLQIVYHYGMKLVTCELIFFACVYAGEKRGIIYNVCTT